MTRLSEHLTIEEFIQSDTALAKGIDNSLPPELIPNAVNTANFLFEPIRRLLNVPLHVDSGYRCKDLNLAVRGVPTSQHVLACAVDIIPVGIDIQQAFKMIEQSGLSFDQLILESTKSSIWIHASYVYGKNRRMVIPFLKKI